MHAVTNNIIYTGGFVYTDIYYCTVYTYSILFWIAHIRFFFFDETRVPLIYFYRLSQKQQDTAVTIVQRRIGSGAWIKFVRTLDFRVIIKYLMI